MRQLASFVLTLAALAACGETPPSELAVTDGYIRLPSPGATMSAAYLTVESPEADRMVAATIEGISTTEMHTVLEDNDGVMRMRPVDGYDIAAGGELVLQPGGHHLMLMGISQPLTMGDERTVTLQFESGREIVTELVVKDPSHPDGGHSHH